MSIFISTIATDVQEVVLQYPSEVWYEKKWIIAILGSLAGVFLITIIDLIREKIKTSKTIKMMTKSLFGEITANRVVFNENLPEDEKNLADFIRMTSTNNFTARPNIVHYEKRNYDYYQLYLRDLGLLKDSLRMKIFFFL